MASGDKVLDRPLSEIGGKIQEEALKAGASGYLTKELGPEALVRAVLGAVQGVSTASRLA